MERVAENACWSVRFMGGWIVLLAFTAFACMDNQPEGRITVVGEFQSAVNARVIDESDSGFMDASKKAKTSEYIASLKARGDEYVRSITSLTINSTVFDDASWINDFTGLRKLVITPFFSTVKRIESIALPMLEVLEIGGNATDGEGASPDEWSFKSAAKEVGAIDCPRLVKLYAFGPIQFGKVVAPMLKVLEIENCVGDVSAFSGCTNVSIWLMKRFQGTVSGDLPFTPNLSDMRFDDRSADYALARYVVKHAAKLAEGAETLVLQALAPGSVIDLSVFKGFRRLKILTLYAESYLDDGTAFTDLPAIESINVWAPRPAEIPSFQNVKDRFPNKKVTVMTPLP